MNDGDERAILGGRWAGKIGEESLQWDIYPDGELVAGDKTGSWTPNGVLYEIRITGGPRSQARRIGKTLCGIRYGDSETSAAVFQLTRTDYRLPDRADRAPPTRAEAPEAVAPPAAKSPAGEGRDDVVDSCPYSIGEMARTRVRAWMALTGAWRGRVAWRAGDQNGVFNADHTFRQGDNVGEPGLRTGRKCRGNMPTARDTMPRCSATSCAGCGIAPMARKDGTFVLRFIPPTGVATPVVVDRTL